MVEFTKEKVHSIFKTGVFVASALLIAYLLVFHASFLPFGYDVISEDEESIKIASYDFFNQEKEIHSLTPTKEEVWIAIDLLYEIQSQKEMFVLVFFALFLSIYFSISSIKEGKNRWSVVATMAFSFLGTVLGLYSRIDRIKALIDLISNS